MFTVPQDEIFNDPMYVSFCISKDNYMKFLNCLEVGGKKLGYADVDDHNRDFIEAMAFFNDPQNLPCFPFGGGDVQLQLRLNPENECLLEQSTNGGVDWTTVADLSACAITGPPGPQGIQGVPGDPGAPGATGEYPADAQTVNPITGQDNDNIFGACMAVVEWLYGETVDMMAQAEAASDVLAFVNNAIAAIPGFGTVYDLAGLDNAVALFVDAAEIGVSALEAAYDINVQRDMACILFCEIIANADDFNVAIWDTAIDQYPSALPLNPAAIAMTTYGNFLKYAFRFPAREYSLGLNNADSDWSTLCTDCNDPEICKTYSLADLAAWSYYNNDAGVTIDPTYNPSTGWGGGFYTGGALDFAEAYAPQPPQPGSYRITFSGTLPAGGTGGGYAVRLKNATTGALIRQANGTFSGTAGGTFEAVATISVLEADVNPRIGFNISRNSASSPWVDAVEIECL